MGRGQGKGQGSPGGPGKAGGADRSSVAKGSKNLPKNLRESIGQDSDAWGSINDRDVAKALQDLWGKIPPGYRRIVAQYFKDISGLETESTGSEEESK